ncbi:transcriptional regulator [Tateyamaria sp. ANG-S1]|nr:transcriptional regulator [Tateyamaria sp. ANG-S1]
MDLPLGEIGLGNYAPYLMNRIMGRYNASLRDEMSAMGLTTVKMRTIAVLAVIDGPLIRDLAVYAVAEQSTLSRALDTLEESGLIRREADSTDNRSTRIFLTNEGREAFERIWPRMSASYAAMFKGISDEEQRAFVSTLQTLLRNIRKHNF